MTAVLAADIGGGSVRAARVGADGAIEARRSEATPDDPAAGYDLVRALWDDLGPADARALVVPGALDAATGEITDSPNLPRWVGTRPGAELSCRALNDANGALLGEAWKGALQGRASAVMVTLGTGVGGGVLVFGRLWEGARGAAGEIGRVPVDPEGDAAPSLGPGALELTASATAVARAAGTADAAEAARRARDGDASARAAFRAAGRALGIALSGVVNVLNPEAVCFGGGMSEAFDLMEETIRAELARRTTALAYDGLALVPAALGGDAGLLGAAWAALA